MLLERSVTAFIGVGAPCPHPSSQGSGTDRIPARGLPNFHVVTQQQHPKSSTSGLAFRSAEQSEAPIELTVAAEG